MNTIPDKPEATDGDRVCANTDRELFREAPGDYYAHSLHVTAGGQIGINVGGLVFVKTLKAWHSLAIQTEDYVAARLAAVEAERDALRATVAKMREARQILPVSLDHSDAVPLRRAFILVLSGLGGKLAGKNFGSDKTSSEHLVWMIGECLLNIRTMQIDKLSRWIGFIQGVLAANGLLDVDEERERTRPLFHKAYAELTALRSQGDKL